MSYPEVPWGPWEQSKTSKWREKPHGASRHVLCEECLTRGGKVSVVVSGRACRRCGHVPVLGALSQREIRACLGTDE